MKGDGRRVVGGGKVTFLCVTRGKNGRKYQVMVVYCFSLPVLTYYLLVYGKLIILCFCGISFQGIPDLILSNEAGLVPTGHANVLPEGGQL